jgi:hypothetical protein
MDALKFKDGVKNYSAGPWHAVDLIKGNRIGSRNHSCRRALPQTEIIKPASRILARGSSSWSCWIMPCEDPRDDRLMVSYSVVWRSNSLSSLHHIMLNHILVRISRIFFVFISVDRNEALSKDPWEDPRHDLAALYCEDPRRYSNIYIILISIQINVKPIFNIILQITKSCGTRLYIILYWITI